MTTNNTPITSDYISRSCISEFRELITRLSKIRKRAPVTYNKTVDEIEAILREELIEDDL